MSFILDALKKSESERQRKGAPGIADVPQARDRSGSGRWWWIIGGLLAINLAVLIGLILRQAPGPIALSGPEPVQLPLAKPADATTARFSEIVADVKRDQPAAASKPTGTTPEPVATAPVRTTPVESRARVVDGPLTFEELRSNGTLQLPDLHLDIHVYSPTPAERFVFINMSRYRENASLAEGPRIQEITQDGVILEHGGTRFLLPRE
jgi:general secretion pathway protein B